MEIQKKQNSWPHAPPHRTLEKGTYMVTAATYEKRLHFTTPDRLDYLQNNLLDLATKYGWILQAWAIFANHYHFIAQSPDTPENLSTFISHLHVVMAKYVNTLEGFPNRRIWYQFWDSHITYQYSYLARLNYVMQNPVRHGVVEVAEEYPWCSTSWFQKSTPTAFFNTVRAFKIDKVSVIDDF
jgi:putative transposase